MSRVAVIGGGVFGARAAIELAKKHEVTLFERGAELLTGATYANHNRHHYGFHYPRSAETAEQCQRSRAGFEKEFGACLDWNFDNYYCVAKADTKTTPDDYVAFCKKHGLAVEAASPPSGVIDMSKIALCLKAKEAVYDTAKLRGMIKERLTGVDVKLGTEITGAELLSSGKKRLHISGGSAARDFDYLVNATYANTNRFAAWLGFAARKLQFNLQELDVIELPLDRRVGVTVQDGNFPSFIPLAGTNRYLMAHVIESQLVREISAGTTPLLGRSNYVESNWSKVREVCAEYLPIVKKATYVKSIFVDRVVDSARLSDDSRVTEIVDHGKGCWSLFSAKVITCVSAAEDLAKRVAAA